MVTRGKDYDGVYPQDNRTWKKQQCEAQHAAYERASMTRAEGPAKDEAVPSEGMKGMKRG